MSSSQATVFVATTLAQAGVIPETAEIAQRLGRMRTHNKNRAYKEGRQLEQGLAAINMNERMNEHPRASIDSTKGHWSNHGREPAQNMPK